MLKIRLARGGAKKRPYYWVVVADARSPRDGRFIEKVGRYNPLLSHENKERVVLNQERVSHWIQKGAQPTGRVALFLGQAGLGQKPEVREKPVKSAPKKKAQERMKERAEKEAAAAEA